MSDGPHPTSVNPMPRRSTMGLGWVVASFDLVPSYFHFGSFHLFISPFSPWFWFAQVIHEDLELFNGELGIDQSYSSHASSPRLLLGIRPSKSRCQHVIHLVGEFGGGALQGPASTTRLPSIRVPLPDPTPETMRTLPRSAPSRTPSSWPSG